MSSSSEADRVRLRAAALRLDGGGDRDKPDAKRDVFADLGSPVSPLRLQQQRATPSSSSSSAGSAKSPALCNAAAAARAGSAGRGSGSGHSGELLVAETASSSSNPPRPPGHRRSGSGPFIFSGGSGGSGEVGA